MAVIPWKGCMLSCWRCSPTVHARVSLLAKTRFTIYFCKPADLRKWDYTHVPRGWELSGTWRETRRNGPQVTGGRLVRGFEAGRKFSLIKRKFRALFGRAGRTRPESSAIYLSIYLSIYMYVCMRRRKARGLAASIDRTSPRDLLGLLHGLLTGLVCCRSA